MRCLLLYDIVDDNKRQKIADVCLDYGLDRVQYSVFFGNISRNLQEEMFQQVQRILGKGDGRLLLIPINQTNWQERLSYERTGYGEL